MSIAAKLTSEGLVSVVSGWGASVMAQVPPSDLVSDWGKFGAVAILGMICMAALWMHYRTLKDLTASHQAATTEMAKLVAELRTRPCIGGNRK
jgi:predicted MFS family arabinose efflux permease